MKVIRHNADGQWAVFCEMCGDQLTGWYEPDEPYYDCAFDGSCPCDTRDSEDE
jgi:hypothetical protein